MQESLLLHSGDKVALAATARKVTPDEVAPAISLLRSWGLQVVVPEGLFDEEDQFAGSDSHRASLLQSLLDDPCIRAIVCVRGGYGTVRIIDRLNFARFLAHPKLIVGYSDVTVLHSHIAAHTAIPSLHAVMPLNIPADAATRPYPAVESLRCCMFSGHNEYRFSNTDTAIPNRAGEALAPVVGGNLSILYSLLASDSDISTDGKILLIEDLDEYLYHIDRMMMALKRAGKLQKLKGLIVGAFTDMHDNSVPFGRSAEAIIREAVADTSFPVAFHAPFGHIGTENLALPLNQTVSLKVDPSSATISF